MSAQWKGERWFELVTSALWGVVHSQLNYPLDTQDLYMFLNQNLQISAQQTIEITTYT